MFAYDLSDFADPGVQRHLEKGPLLPIDTQNPYPLAPGQSIHECLGRVVESSAPDFKEGDLVLALPNSMAGLCEYLVTPAERTIPLPEGVVSKEEILMTQPLGTVIWAFRKLPSVLDLHTVVVGQGPMGLLFTRMLSQMGARTVVGLDKLDYRLEISRQMGATHTVNVDREDSAATVREISEWRMADLVVEVVGHQTGTIEFCLGLVRNGGTMLAFGVPDQTHYDAFPFADFFRQNVALIPSVGPDPQPNFGLARDLIAQKRFDVSPIITHVLPFDNVQKAYEMFVDRKEGAVKVVLDYEK
jgi:threonine dehydrogenase-like Zn-dependent dehydrogenase